LKKLEQNTWGVFFFLKGKIYMKMQEEKNIFLLYIKGEYFDEL